MVGQSLDLSLVREALKIPVLRPYPKSMKQKWGGASKLVFFKSCPGDSDLQLQIKIRSRCPNLPT